MLHEVCHYRSDRAHAHILGSNGVSHGRTNEAHVGSTRGRGISHCAWLIYEIFCLYGIYVHGFVGQEAKPDIPYPAEVEENLVRDECVAEWKLESDLCAE
jgi:hypothetical protein